MTHTVLCDVISSCLQSKVASVCSCRERAAGCRSPGCKRSRRGKVRNQPEWPRSRLYKAPKIIQYKLLWNFEFQYSLYYGSAASPQTKL